MNLSNRRVLVIGLGRTGVATARFCAGEGGEVVIVDEKQGKELGDALTAISDIPVELKLGSRDDEIVSTVDLVVPSPGVPPFHYLLKAARKRRVPVISEVELAYRFLTTPIIAITGTNGKTTTTQLIGEMLTTWGKKVFVGGNIGNPLIGVAGKDEDFDYLVVELSSFQLQWIDRFRSAVAVLLNVGPDHLDYHGTYDEYRRAKERIFENQTDRDLAILNADDAVVASLGRKIESDVTWFSSSSMVEKGMFKDGNVLRYRNHEEDEEEYFINTMCLRGNHNYENIMAAILAVRWCGCPSPAIRQTLETFSGLAHRMEFVGEARGVAFYNDSKGTNVDAVIRALDACSMPVILLLGGRNKGGDFTRLLEPIKKKAKTVIFFGEARTELQTTIGKTVKTSMTETLKEAIDIAWSNAQSGDVVLLSPGCASFDEFKDYEERGNYFRQSIRHIIERN